MPLCPADDDCSSVSSDDVSEYCPSHEEMGSDDSAWTDEPSPDHCFSNQHQSKTVVSSVEGISPSGGQGVVPAARKKKRKIPVGIDMPNDICFLELSQLEEFVDSINRITSCKTSECEGKLVAMSIKSDGLGGGLCIRFGCNGCHSKQAEFITYSKYEAAQETNTISLSVQVAFILAGCTHDVYTMVLSHVLGMKTVNKKAYMNTIEHVYPIVKDALDNVCKVAKDEMKAKPDHELGSWKRAVTTVAGTWKKKGIHNGTFIIRNYMNNALLYYHHLCKSDVEDGLYPGTLESAEEYAARVMFEKAKEEGMEVSIHLLDLGPSSAKAVKEVFPNAQLGGRHVGKAHKGQVEKLLRDVLKPSHFKTLEVSQYVLIGSLSQRNPLRRLHYRLSTNLALLQANMTYAHAKLGNEYHWMPEVFQHMGLPVFDGVKEALEGYSVKRQKRLERVKTIPVKRRRVELKEKRAREEIRRSEWSEQHGCGHTYSGDESTEESDSNVLDVSGGLACCENSSSGRSRERECPSSSRRKRLPRQAALPLPPSQSSHSKRVPVKNKHTSC